MHGVYLYIFISVSHLIVIIYIYVCYIICIWWFWAACTCLVWKIFYAVCLGCWYLIMLTVSCWVKTWANKLFLFYFFYNLISPLCRWSSRDNGVHPNVLLGGIFSYDPSTSFLLRELYMINFFSWNFTTREKKKNTTF